MVLFLLNLKAEQLENVERISLPEDVRFCLTVKNSAGEDVREDVIVDPAESHELEGSRGTANFRLKWDKQARHQAYLNVERVKGVTRDMTAADENQWVPVMGFDCRGLDPISCKLGEFVVKSASGASFLADLEEGDWMDVDERGDSVSVMGIEAKFTVHKR